MVFLAIRHLLSRKRQTALTLLGIVLGTAAYIAISGMMLGFQTYIIDQLVNNDAHLRISAREEMLTEHGLDEAFFPDGTLIHWLKAPSGRKDNAYIISPRSWLERLAADEEVSAASPQLVVQGLATAGKISTGVSIVGSDPEKQKMVSSIESSMLQGKFADIGNSGNRLAVGEGLLKKLGATRHETITLSVGRGSPQAFRIVSVFRMGVKGIDDTRVYASLSDVQKLNQTPSRVSDIAIRLREVTLASATASFYNLIGPEKVQSWDQANEGIMSVFKTQDIVRNAMTISILVVAGFGIYNILSLAVTHKRRDIAILRSIGFEPKDISRLFLVQGLILGLCGGLLGILCGLAACSAMGQIEVSEDRGLGGNHLMISYELMIYVKALGLALVSAAFASYFPARSAGKLEPIEIIRGENS